MPEPHTDPPLLPTTRWAGCPFDPPEGLTRLREDRPLSRMSYPDGHIGWLAADHRTVRAVFADSRFSSRYELMHYPFPGGADVEMRPAPIGDITAMDPPEHTYYRRLLTGKFTVRRMRMLTARIEQIAAEHLDAMRRQGPPLDLISAYAYPIPALIICELLGVPYEDQGEFFQRVGAVNDLGNTTDDVSSALTALESYVRDLVDDKRAHPTDDLLSDLAKTELSDDELAGIGGLLLGAGLDTTANMIGLGTFALLRHPDQFALLRADPGIADDAVEELLRYLSNVHTAVKAAVDDVELGGQVIKAGETVTLSIQAANRDPARFTDPDTLDLTRRPSAHMAFGHGIHQCLGQQLARVEMRVALPALVTRFPTLRLAVDPNDIPMRSGSIYGVYELPVTWDEE